MSQETTKPQQKFSAPSSTSDTASIAASAIGTIIKGKGQKLTAKTAAGAANDALRNRMTYKGGLLPEGAAFHRLMEQYRGGTLPSLREMWPVLLFFGFEAGVALAILIIQLSQ